MASSTSSAAIESFSTGNLLPKSFSFRDRIRVSLKALQRSQYSNTTKAVSRHPIATAVSVQVMKVILIFASLLTLVPMVRADEVIVRHDRNVVEHNHYHHHYRHHEVVVVHPN
jgi:hypothetical protein